MRRVALECPPLADLLIEVEHTLSQEEAVGRIERVLSSGSHSSDMALLENVKYVQQEGRFAFSGKAKGFKVSGKLAVLENSVKMVVVLPWAAKPFHKTAHAAIQSGLKKALA